MPYSSVDIDRINAMNKVIDTSGQAADAGASGLSAIGGNVGAGISKALGNRAAKLQQEGKLRADLEDTLAQLEDQNRQQIMAGQDNTKTRQLIARVKDRLRSLGSVDLSEPTPTSPILKQGGLTPGERPGLG